MKKLLITMSEKLYDLLKEKKKSSGMTMAEIIRRAIKPEEPKAENIAPVEEDNIDDSFLPKKNSFRVGEVSEYFGVDERTIRTWIDHGHLKAEKVVGSIMITRKSILHCRFHNQMRNRMI